MHSLVLSLINNFSEVTTCERTACIKNTLYLQLTKFYSLSIDRVVTGREKMIQWKCMFTSSGVL